MTSKNESFAVMAGSDVQIEPTAQKLKCGLIMPISKSQGLEPEHWLHVKGIICEALADTDFEIRLVSESDDVGVIHKSIVQNIYQNDIVICDVSTHNANVMFELGLRLAFDKPTVIIKDDETPFSFDTQVIEHIVYKRSLHYVDILSFKKKLKEKVMATLKLSQEPSFSTFLKHFTINHVAKIEERTVGINDVVMERLDLMQKSINAISQQSQRRPPISWNLLTESYDDLANVPLNVKDSVTLFLNALAEARGNTISELVEHLRSISGSELNTIVSQYYEFVRSVGINKKFIPVPPPGVREEILTFINKY